MEPVYVFITMSDGEVSRIMQFQRGPMRSQTLPVGAQWIPDQPGFWTREATDANLFAEVMKSCPSQDQNGLPLPQPVSYKIIQPSDIPTDRTYRDALEHDGATVHYNLTKARDIQLTKVRQARTEALGELDKAWMKATGQKDQVAADAVEAQRQVLRDLPTTLGIEKAATIDDLKALWPVELAKR